jgi:hypothetical protein
MSACLFQIGRGPRKEIDPSSHPSQDQLGVLLFQEWILAILHRSNTPARPQLSPQANELIKHTL